jgi:hypothetical protein
MFRVTVSGPRELEASFFTVVVWRDLAESPSKGSRILGQPDRGPGQAPAAELDRRGRQRPLRGQGCGQGAGAEPPLGDGDDHQDHAQH